ncbi:MAG TPA: hypothetical protein VFA81_10905 [Burkholderiales bacterium]|nr:hypothetical protein [Burkholderiales bacterium]
MTYRRIHWTIDDLFVLLQYPRKSCKEIAAELGMHPKTVAAKLREQGRAVLPGANRKKRGVALERSYADFSG